MNQKKQRLEQITQQIRNAEHLGNRIAGSVRLLAVSKTKPAGDIAAFYRLGQRHFAESYLQEALIKQQALSHFHITWHFIGPIQSNKTKLIARHFSWVHSVDRFKIAKRFSEQRPDYLPALNICLQVNISAEESKSGVSLEELPLLIEQIRPLPRLRLRGVMAIPEPETDRTRQRQPYQQLYSAVQRLKLDELETFSFGMSQDLTAAIQEGATLVRIGTGLFGARSQT